MRLTTKKNKYLLICGSLLAAFVSTSAIANNTNAKRQASAHVHGSHVMEMAIDKNTVAINYQAPLEDFKNNKQLLDKVDHQAAEKLFKQLISLAPLAKCQIVEAEVETTKLDDDKHGHDHKHHHKHDHHKHDHDKKGTEGGHSDVHLEAQLTCEYIEKLDRVELLGFKTLKTVNEIKVNVVSGQKVMSETVRQDQPVVNF